MPDYSNGKIYAIKFFDNDKYIYIGSTTQELSKRLGEHRRHFKCSLYRHIQDNYDGDFKCCYIELHQKHPCKDRYELDKIEGEIIRQFKADENYEVINKSIAGRTQKQRYIDNIDLILEQKKEYYKKNIDSILEKRKQYYKQNIDIIKERNKSHYHKTKNILSLTA